MITLRNVCKKFNGHYALKDINVQFSNRTSVPNPSTAAIIGPSGSGKSTLLRCINGLETPDSGSVEIDGTVLNSTNVNKLCFKIGMVFQQFNLFPHMSVADNLTYGPCKVLGVRKEQAQDKAAALLEKFGIISKLSSSPLELSGGQKQRVAIARALMMDPEIMLFDEPTSALDPEVMKDILAIINELKNNMTMIIVSHHVKFARAAADRIIFMDQGQILADQPGEEFFAKPKSHRARLFLENIGDLM